MRKNAVIFMEDIMKNISLVERFIFDMNKTQFMKDVKTHYSVIRCLEIIGEAVKNTPLSIRNKYSDIPWKDIAGMRDKLIHGYFGVNLERVWIVIKDDLPELKIKIGKILKEIEE